MRVAIIGGGVAGSTMALFLSKEGVKTTLFEKRDSLISGPPFCHLHAGGNLYREISDEQCLTLLRQSIEFANLYPFIVDKRPTIIATPKDDDTDPNLLKVRLKLLQDEYKKLIDIDQRYKVLGDAHDYFKIYDKKELLELKKEDIKRVPQSLDDWMIPFAKNVDLNTLRYPVYLVQEYGLNLFRLSGALELYLKKQSSIDLKFNKEIKEIRKDGDKWIVDNEEFDYLINAAGFKTGMIDDIVGIKSERMVEFKAAFVTKCDTKGVLWPEVIFHGKRGTPNGMGQFTPYPNGYFQLHFMSKEATLFSDGLSKNSKFSAQPKLKDRFIKKIEYGWEDIIVKKRTKKAIEHLSKFIPNFNIAKTASIPLFGAQQIPGSDPTLRVAEVSFDIKNYARCEIVKVSSVIDMARGIFKDMGLGDIKLNDLVDIDEKELSKKAKEIANKRGYPKDLASRLIN